MLKDLEAIPLDIDFNPLNWDYEITEIEPAEMVRMINGTIEIVSYEIDEETLQEVGKAIEEIEAIDPYHY